MKILTSLPIFSLIWCLSMDALLHGEPLTPPVLQELRYKGLCDASATARLNEDVFLLAGDENNTVAFYSFKQASKAIKQVELSTLLQQSFLKKKLKKKKLKREKKLSDREFDIEAAVRVGDIVYWIGSHTAHDGNKKSTPRQQLLATLVEVSKQGESLRIVGQPYRNLRDALLKDAGFLALGLHSKKDKIKRLNIEGLGKTKEGSLLIGLRTPLRKDKAVVIVLNNPYGVLHGEAAQFSPPIVLSLSGRGIRGITFWNGAPLLLAVDEKGAAPPLLVRIESGGVVRSYPLAFDALESMNLESVLSLGDDVGSTASVMLVSDDGEEKVEGKRCKDLTDADQKSFRVVHVPISITNFTTTGDISME